MQFQITKRLPDEEIIGKEPIKNKKKQNILKTKGFLMSLITSNIKTLLL